MAPRTEQAIRFGPGQRLLGIVNGAPGDGPVACLLLNVGVTHRIGPRRLNVKLARALGAVGVTSLRFDLSGIGDSGPAAPDADYRSQAVADLRAAMDHLEAAHGIRRFVVLGLCSGAVNGYRAAQADARIAGLMMFDGYAFPTWTTNLLHDWRRLLTTPWRRRMAKALNRVRRRLGRGAAASAGSIFYATRDSTAPDRDAYAAVMRSLAERGTRMLVMYSGSMLARHNHASQFRRAFAGQPFLAAVEDHYLPHIDHVATAQSAQAELVAIVKRWVGSLIGAAGAGRSLVFDEARAGAATAGAVEP
jgi:dienelactone hydrolase